MTRVVGGGVYLFCPSVSQMKEILTSQITALLVIYACVKCQSGEGNLGISDKCLIGYLRTFLILLFTKFGLSS